MSDDLVKRLRNPANIFRENSVHVFFDGEDILYKAADRIEELEADLRKMAIDYLAADWQAAELEADLRKMALDYLAADGQAAEAYQAQLATEARIEELEAKLDEAMGLALNQCPFEYGTEGYNDWWQDRYKRLAQLEGDKL